MERVLRKKTLNQYLLSQRKIISIDVLTLVEIISKSFKKISYFINKGILSELIGSLNSINSQGEIQQNLDIFSNNILVEYNEFHKNLSSIFSEELDKIHIIYKNYSKGKYLLLFDPLDGSSNIKLNISIGTIFSILNTPILNYKNNFILGKDFLQKGIKQIISGYAMYGPQTTIIITLGNGVFGFTLDKFLGLWIMTYKNLNIPKKTLEISLNMSQIFNLNYSMKKYVNKCFTNDEFFKKKYNMRWVGSMVADIHSILMRGGLFIYSWNSKKNKYPGKIRIMYEANPISMLIKQANGLSTNGIKNIMNIQPVFLNQKTSIVLGSKNEVCKILSYHII